MCPSCVPKGSSGLSVVAPFTRPNSYSPVIRLTSNYASVRVASLLEPATRTILIKEPHVGGQRLSPVHSLPPFLTYPEVLVVFCHSAGTACPKVSKIAKESPFVAGLIGSH